MRKNHEESFTPSRATTKEWKDFEQSVRSFAGDKNLNVTELFGIKEKVKKKK
jgi:hypothetical protein